MNLNLLLKLSLWLFCFITTLLICCLAYSLLLHEAPTPFLYTAIIFSILAVLVYFTIRYHKNLQQNDNNFLVFIILFLIWLAITIIGTLPYGLSNTFNSGLDAYFESVSGFTTTGTTLLPAIENNPRSILIWRSLTHWIGGILTLGMAIIIFPALDIGGYRLLGTSKNVHNEKDLIYLLKRIFLIYGVLTLIEILLLVAGGMDVFNSICHSFGTVATGSFSTFNKGIEAFSVPQQYIVISILVLSGISYVHYFNLLTSNIDRKKDIHIGIIFVTIIFGLTALITGALYFGFEASLEKSFRLTLLHVSSFITTTGYSTFDLSHWPAYVIGLLFALMFIGGSANTTTGGIKLSRFFFFFKKLNSSFNELSNSGKNKKLVTPSKYRGKGSFISIQLFIILFLITFFIGNLAFSSLGFNLKSSSIYAISSLSSTGIDFGKIDPTFSISYLPLTGKIIMICLMLIGRLEIYIVPVVIIFSLNEFKNILSGRANK